MSLDIKQIFVEAFIKLFENVLWLVPIAFIIAIYLFFFRIEIAHELELTNRGRNNLTEKLFLALATIITATLAYLYIKEQYFLLSLTISFIMTYFLYMIGILDMIVEKLEGKYGRY